MEEYFDRLVHATAVWSARFCEDNPDADEEELVEYIVNAFAEYRAYVQRERVRDATLRAARLTFRLRQSGEATDEQALVEAALRDLSSGPPYKPLPKPVSVEAEVEVEAVEED